VLQSGHIEANRVNIRCYDKHEELPYLPKQRYGLFSTKKNVLLDFIALYAEDLLPVVTNFLISLAHRNKDHVGLFLRKTQHLECMPFPDYTVDLSPKPARKNTRAHVLSR
jgi:hypothetical protein